jgi:hypothetical protein
VVGTVVAAIIGSSDKPSPASSDAGSESDGSASDSADWLASNPVAPNASGQWAATIRTPPPPRAVTVVAVEMPEPAGLDGDPEDCTNCSPSSTIDHARALRRRGPAAPDVVSASEPVEARPD